MKTLAIVEELELRDSVAAAAIAEVEELQTLVERARERAAGLLAFQRSLPRERAMREAAVAGARDALTRAEAACADAERELERARERERANAQRALDDARANLRAASAELERANATVAALEHEAEQAEAEALELEPEAAVAAERLVALPRLSRDATRPPAHGLAGVEEWGARARPALLLLHAALAAERDGIVREANELGSAVLGEALGATSVRRVRERLEAARP